MQRKTLKKLYIIIAIIIAAACISGCGILPSNDLKAYTAEFYDCFDTVITITAYCRDQAEFDALSQEIHEDLQYCHKLFDIYNEYDGLNNACTVNRKAGSGEFVQVPVKLVTLIEMGKQMYSETGGNVNIAFGAITRLWHEAREKAESGADASVIPSEDALREAAKHCDIDKIVIGQDCSVRLDDPKMSLDLGAIAKGFAVETVCGKLSSEKKMGILINAGGNVVPQGDKGMNKTGDRGVPWTIAIEEPDEKSGQPYADVLQIDGRKCVVTSGSYQRYFEVDGMRYHHIIDKDSLRPENRFLSVSVINRDSGMADAYSTAVFNMDLEEGRAFVEKTDDLEALWILPDGTHVESSGWAAYRKK